MKAMYEKRQKQIGCIFCGRSFLLEKFDLDKLDNWDIDWKVLQIRRILPGPGRGRKIKGQEYGFPVIPEESLSILEMARSDEYDYLVEAIKKRLIRIVKAYKKVGIIGEKEI